MAKVNVPRSSSTQPKKTHQPVKQARNTVSIPRPGGKGFSPVINSQKSKKNG